MLEEHEKNPFCYICNLFFAPDYMPLHLKIDHTKDELAAHLLLAYFDDWLEQQEAIEHALEPSSATKGTYESRSSVP